MRSERAGCAESRKGCFPIAFLLSAQPGYIPALQNIILPLLSFHTRAAVCLNDIKRSERFCSALAVQTIILLFTSFERIQAHLKYAQTDDFDRYAQTQNCTSRALCSDTELHVARVIKIDLSCENFYH